MGTSVLCYSENFSFTVKVSAPNVFPSLVFINLHNTYTIIELGILNLVSLLYISKVDRLSMPFEIHI